MKNTRTPERFDAFLQAASLAADGAAKILLNYFGNLRKVDEKFQAGLVSEADRESEAFIVNFLRSRFPDHSFLGEESGLSDGNTSGENKSASENKSVSLAQDETKAETRKESERGSLWIIDPLDGTTNYVHQFPVFCISIALQVDGELVVGLIDAPKMGLRYHAVKGRGAFLNGEPIHVSRRDRFRDGLFATGFASVDDGLAEQFALIEATVTEARGIRRAGAAAMDLCFVAQGVFDVFWEKSLQPWDTAAGTLLVREAGGVVTDFAGQPFAPNKRDIVAGSPALHGELLKRIVTIRSARG